jgi:hypothetical protein
MYVQAASSLASTGRLSEALELTRENKASPNVEARLNILRGEAANYFAKMGNWKQMQETIDSISNPISKVAFLAGTVSDSSWNSELPQRSSLVVLLMNFPSKREAASQLLKLALDTASSISDATARARGLAAIACSQARIGDLAGCQSTQEMIPSDSTYRPFPTLALVRARAALGEKEAARQLLGQLKGPLLQAQGFAQLAEGQMDHGDAQDALDSADKAWEMVKGSRNDSTVANFLMRMRIKVGDCEGAVTPFAEIDREDATFVYRAIALDQASAGDFKSSLKTLDEHFESGNLVKLHALQSLAKQQSEENDEKDAQAWARQRTDPQEQAFALLGVAEGLFKRQKR